ncbi:hypothetical protein Q7P35_009247 [Cladosporium inversicolor]
MASSEQESGTMSSQNGYNTIAQNGFAANEADAEGASLLRKPTQNNNNTGSSVVTRLYKHFTADISKSWADIALLGCYIITGLLDSSSVFIWGSFVSMQTGNTVYLGLGVVAPNDNDRWMRSGISILFFCLGSLFFSLYHRKLSPRQRWVLVSSHVIQLLLIIAAAAMVTLGPPTSKESPFSIFIAAPIALIAFQAAGQAVTSRVLQYNGLTSVVLTSIYCDLFSDPNLLAGFQANPERNRRAAAPVLLLFGAILGGLWAHSSVGLAGALWTAVALKSFVVIAWMLWAADTKA